MFLMTCSDPKTSPAVPVSAGSADLTLKPGKIRTDAGTFTADCGTLVVPENRATRDSRLIALPMIRVRITGSTPAEPIFWLEGGPGMSNLKFKPPAWLLANHAVVAVGYRGVDGSVVLDCLVSGSKSCSSSRITKVCSCITVTTWNTKIWA